MIPKILNGRGEVMTPLTNVTVRLKLREWSDLVRLRAFIAMLEKDMKTVTFVVSNNEYVNIQLFVRNFEAEYWNNLRDEHNVEVFISNATRL